MVCEHGEWQGDVHEDMRKHEWLTGQQVVYSGKAMAEASAPRAAASSDRTRQQT